MKNLLFTLLIELLVKKLTKLIALIEDLTELTAKGSPVEIIKETYFSPDEAILIRRARNTSTRVFTPEEQIKFTKASQQFLQKHLMEDTLSSDMLEQVITNLLLYSKSRFVTLRETKWAIRHKMTPNLDPVELSFLDRVLYQHDDAVMLQ